MRLYTITHRLSIGNNMNIKIGNDKNKYKVGIHLIEPNYGDLLNAIEQAVRDGFKTIYVHSMPNMQVLRDQIADKQLELKHVEGKDKVKVFGELIELFRLLNNNYDAKVLKKVG